MAPINKISRRSFIGVSTAAVAASILNRYEESDAVAQTTAPFKTVIKKAVIVQKPTEDELKKIKDAGFDGVEAGVIPVNEAEKCRTIAEKVGLRIHSVIRGWAEFNSPDNSKVEQTYKVTEDAIVAAQAYGADAVLLVPCRIGGMKMPEPWEFLIDYDRESGHIKSVTVGDNSPYEEYIKAHNYAVDRSREMVKRLIPLAEKCKVVIALENVWNNLWVRPAIFRDFVASFQSPFIKAYFDIGNHVKYAPSEEWILTLNNLLAKLHAKDFKLDQFGGGNFVNIRDGSVRWPVVRRALEKVGYNGWLTIEGGSCTLEEHSRRLDLIIAGK
ncbi:MAG: sugar phosphate isomerase/epimerase family protein [Limisphaerales bacterium]|jgi:hexulose-6-phosphate isomerase